MAALPPGASVATLTIVGGGSMGINDMRPSSETERKVFGCSLIIKGIVAGGAPSRAVDGNTNQVFLGGSCSHTDVLSGGAWWQVDMQASYQVNTVTLYNR